MRNTSYISAWRRGWLLAAAVSALVFAAPAAAATCASPYAVGGGTVTTLDTDDCSDDTGTGGGLFLTPNTTFGSAGGDVVTFDSVTINSSSSAVTLSGTGDFQVVLHGNAFAGAGEMFSASSDGVVTLDTTSGAANSFTGNTSVSGSSVQVTLGDDTFDGALEVNATTGSAQYQDSSGTTITFNGDFAAALTIGGTGNSATIAGTVSNISASGIGVFYTGSGTLTVAATGSISSNTGILANAISTGQTLSIDNFGTITGTANAVTADGSSGTLALTLEDGSVTGGTVRGGGGDDTVTLYSAADISTASFNGNGGTNTLVLTGDSATDGTLDETTVVNFAGTVTKSGTSTWTLTNSGGAHIAGLHFALDGGTLVGTTTTVTGDIDIASGATFDIDQDDDGTYSGTIKNGGSLAKHGLGAVALTGPLKANGADTGGIDVEEGELDIGSGDTTEFTAGDITIGIGTSTIPTLALNTSYAVNNSGAIADDGIFSVTNALAGNTITFSGNASGGGEIDVDGPGDTVLSGDNTLFASFNAIFKQGTGTLTLSGDNSGMCCAVEVDAGTLRLETDTALGDSIVFAGDAVIDLADGLHILNPVETTGGSNTQFLVTTGTAHWDYDGFSFGGIVGPGSIEKTGAGTLTVQYLDVDGPVTVSAGTLVLDGDFAASPFPRFVIASGATLDIHGDQDIDGIEGAGTITNNGSADADLAVDYFFADPPFASTFGGVIQDGAHAIHLTVEEGNLTLTNANTYTGGTFICSCGTLTLADGGSIVGDVDVEGELTFDKSSAFTFTGGIAIDGGTINVTGGGNVTLAGDITDAFTASTAIFKDGAGTLTLSGNNDFVGDVELHEGTLRLASDTALGDAGNQLITTGSVVDYADGVTNGNIIVVNSNTTQFQVLTGSAHQTGLIGEISPPARPMEKIGDGTLIVDQVGVSGAITVTGGTLAQGQAGAFPASANPFVVGAAGTLDLAGFELDALSLNGAGTITNSGSSDALLDIGLGLGAPTSMEFSGVIKNGLTNKLALTVHNTAPLILSGNNTYTGDTLICDCGTLQLGNGGTSGAITSDVTNNGVLIFDRSNLYSFAFKIEQGLGSPGQVQQTGAGTTVLTNAGNSYTGGTTISAGILRVTHGTNLGTSSVGSGLVTLNGGTFQSGAAGLAFTNGFALHPTGTVDTNGNTLTLTGVLQDDTAVAGMLTKTGSGTLILTNSGNSYTGGTTVLAGTLRVTHGTGSVGSGLVTLNGGTFLSGAAGLAFTNGFALHPTGTVDTNGNTLTLGGVLQDDTGVAGVLTVTGGGTLILTNAGNSYTGGTTVGASSTLQLSQPGAAGAGAVTLSSGTLVADFTGTLGNGIVFAPSSDNAIQATAGKTLTLTGAMTFNNGASDTVQFGSVGNTGTIIVNPSALTPGASPGALVIAGGTVKDAAGNTKFVYALGNMASVTVNTGATFQIDSDGNGRNPAQSTFIKLFGGGQVVLGSAVPRVVLGNSNFAGTFSGTGYVGIGEQFHPADATFTGDNNDATEFQIAPGSTLQLGNGGTSGAIADSAHIVGFGLPAFSGGFSTLEYNHSNDVAFGGHLIGNFILEQIGTGILTISGNNSASGGAVHYSGNVVVASGGLRLSSDLNLDGAPIALFNGTTLYTTTTNTFTSPVSVAGDPTFNVAVGTTASWAGLIADGASAGTVEIGGGGTFAPTNTGNSYSGGTAVTGSSTLRIGNSGELGHGNGTITLDNGTLQFAAGLVLSNGIAIPVGSTATFDTSGNTATLTGAIAGNAVRKIGAGTLILGGNNVYSGGTVVAEGAVQISNAAQLGSGGLTLGAPATTGTIKTGFGVNLSQAITIAAGGGVIDASDSGGMTVSGTVVGSAIVTFRGDAFAAFPSDEIVLSGSVTTAGTIVDSVLIDLVGHDASTGAINSDIAFTGGGFNFPTVQFEHSDAYNYAQIISGPGIVIVNGTGSVTFAGLNTYSLGTQVLAGTLKLGIDNALPTSGNVTMGGTGILDLNGHNQTIGALGSFGAVGEVRLSGHTLTINPSFTGGYFGVITGSGNLVKNGSTQFTLTGANTYTGTTTINSGILQIGNDGTTGSIAGDVVDNAELRFDRTDNVTFGQAISGSGQVNKLGSGTLTLSNTNTYTGQTFVTAGTLSVNGSIAISSSTFVASGATLGGTGTVGAVNVGSGGALSPGNSIGTLHIAGDLLLQSGSTFGVEASPTDSDLADALGAVTLGGTLIVNFQTGVAYAPHQYTIADGTSVSGVFSTVNTLGLPTGFIIGVNKDATHAFVNLNYAQFIWGANPGTTNWFTDANWQNGLSPGNAAGAQDVLFGATTKPAIDIGANTTAASLQFSVASPSYAFNIAVGAGLTLNGLGIVDGPGNKPTFNVSGGLTFSGNATAGDSTIVVANLGSVSFTGQSTPGSAKLVTLTANTEIDMNVTTGPLNDHKISAGSIAGPGFFNVAGNMLTVGSDNTSTEVSGTIAGASGALVKTGTGTLTISGSAGYTGGTTINAGTLQIGNGGTTGSVAGGVLDNATLAFDRPDIFTFAGTISGSGAVQQIGSGTTILTAANTYGGTTTISAGTLQIGNGGTTGSIDNSTVVDNAVLQIARSKTFAFNNSISGTGTLVQAGSGTLVLTGNNTYSGGTAITSGTLQVETQTPFGSGAVIDNSHLIIGPVGGFALANAISGSGDVTINAGTFTAIILTGANAYSGGTTISSGTLQIGNNGTTGSIAGNITNSDHLTFSRSDTLIYSDVISGAGNVTQAGNGTTIFTGENTYTGITAVSGGFLQIGNGGTTGSLAGNVSINGGSLVFDRSDIVTFGFTAGFGGGKIIQAGTGTLILTGDSINGGGTNILSGTLQFGNGGTHGSVGSSGLTSADIVGDILDNGTLVFDRSDDITYSNGTITGSGSLVQAGTGRLSLFGSNSYTGGTVISSGILRVVTGLGPIGIVGDIVDNGTFEQESSQPTSYAGMISGTGSLRQVAGLFALTGNNTYNGGTTIDSGQTLQLGNGGTSGSIAGNVFDQGALVFNRSDVVSFGGIISGTGLVKQSGSGTAILTNTNTYTGGTTISAGTLQIGNGGISGSIVGDVSNSGTLAFNRSDNTSFGNVISGSGGVTKLGASTLTLTGTQAYSGPTAVNGGTLAVNGSIALSAVTVNSGGILGGTGTVGSTTIASGGTLAAGNSIGTLNVAGGLSLLSGSLLVAEVSPSASDLISATGAVGIAGNLLATFQTGVTYLPHRYTLITTTGALSGTFASVNTLGIPTGFAASVSTDAHNAYLNLIYKQFIWGTAPATTAWFSDANWINGLHPATDVDVFFDATTEPAIDVTGSAQVASLQFTSAAPSYTFNISGAASSMTLTGQGVNDTVGNAPTFNLTNAATMTFAGGSTAGDARIFADSGAHVVFTGTSNAGAAALTALNSGVIDFSGTTGAANDHNVSAGSIAGSGTFALGGDALTTGSNNSSTEVSGVISGTGALVKVGSGTLTLSGTETYTGGTTITAGTLQIGAGGAAGSIAGDVTDNAVLAFNHSNSFTFAGVVSGTGAVNQAGSGTTILTAANTYSGGTIISAGALQIGNGSTTGAIAGNVADNAILAFNRSDSVTFGGLISGSGAVQQNGTGTTILAGTNTYSGGTTIAAGTLQIGAGGTSGSVAGNIADNAVLAFNRSDSFTVDGIISGSGGVQQTGTGTTALTGANTYTGGTTVAAGTLQIGAGGTSGSIAGNVSDNATLAFNRSDSLTFAGVVSGTGAVRQVGTGTTILTGTNTYSGGTTILTGTLQIGAGGTAGSIAGGVIDNGTLAFNRADAVSFANAVSGSGGLRQGGSGTLTLPGSYTYTGLTQVAAGTLSLTGTLTSAVTVASGGSLAGTGTMASLVVASGGTVTPGIAGVGTLNVTGATALVSGSNYTFDATNGVSDRINVTGAASLGGTVTVTAAAGTYTVNSRIALVTTTAGVSGVFSSLTLAGSFGSNIHAVFDYDATHAYLLLQPIAISTLLPPDAPDNEKQVAAAIDDAIQNHNAGNTFAPLAGLSTPDLQAVLDRLSGEVANGLPDGAFQNLDAFLELLLDPANENRSGGNGPALSFIAPGNDRSIRTALNGPLTDMAVANDSGGGAAALVRGPLSVWGAMQGGWSNHQGNLVLGTHDTNIGNGLMALGVDIRPEDQNLVLGTAVSIGQTWWTVHEGLGTGHANAQQLGVYASKRFGAFYVSAAAAIAAFESTTMRSVLFGGNNVYRAHTDGQSEGVRVEAGWRFEAADGTAVTPYALLQAEGVQTPAYGETTLLGNPALALSFAHKSESETTHDIGFEIDRTFAGANDNDSSLQARVGWVHDYSGGISRNASLLAFPGSSFVVSGVSPPRDAAQLMLAANTDLDDGLFVSVKTQALLSGGTQDFSGNLALGYRW